METENKDYYDRNLTLLRAYRAGDAAAGETLASLNLPLVCSIASRFSDRGVALEDLISFGNIGLVKAMASFDFERGCAFSTYAVPMIFGEIRRYLRDEGMIRVSREEKKLSTVLNAERERRLAAGERADVQSLAEAAGVSAEDAASALFAGASVRSLDETVFDDEGTTLGATVCDEEQEERDFDRLALRLAIEKLPPADRRLILLRYFRDLSQAETAKRLGVTQVRVSRQEKKIMERLRQELS